LQYLSSLSFSSILTRKNVWIAFSDPSHRKYCQIWLLFFGSLAFGVFGPETDDDASDSESVCKEDSTSSYASSMSAEATLDVFLVRFRVYV
jgi:hypothetical protein